MNIELYNGFWIATDQYLNPQQLRDENGRLVFNYLRGLGWTREAVAGILGNMDVESSMNPALIEGRGYHTLIDNNTCLNLGGSIGVGLVQWTGTTPTPPAGQKLASFAIRYNQQWYDGNLQLFRLEREFDEDLQFQHGTVDGVSWDWQSYVTSTETPEQLAKVWQLLYENGGSDTETRQAKARYYYELYHSSIILFWWGYVLNKRKELKRQWIRV